MTNLTLDSYGVQEMNEGEMVNVNGGEFWTIFVICVAIGFVVAAICNTRNGSDGTWKAVGNGSQILILSLISCSLVY